MRAALLGYLDLVCGDHVDGTGAGNCMEKEREREVGVEWEMDTLRCM